MARVISQLVVPRKNGQSDVSEQIADTGQLNLAAERLAKAKTVRVQKGDTLASLAARHGVSAANMVTWNKLKPNAHLSSGQSLAVLVPTSQSPRLSPRPAPHKRNGSATVAHHPTPKHAKR